MIQNNNYILLIMIMSTRNFISLGIMTGTSLDGVDLSIIKSDGNRKVVFLGGTTFSFSPSLRKSLYSILGSTKRDSVIDRIEYKYTDFIIQKMIKFLNQRVEKIDIIGFHGQTITHNPELDFTWQLGNAKRISNFFKVKTIYDFRANDILNGGNGAPLTPIFHKLLKVKYDLNNVAFVNLGGISNLTLIINNNIIAFDCGPCCSISNELIINKINKNYDYNGRLASRGKSNFKIIKKLLSHRYFKIKPPKSMDRLNIPIDEVYHLNLYDGLATVNSFIVEAIALGIKSYLNKIDSIILIGGGRKNLNLKKKLENRFKNKVIVAEDLGIDGDLVEANAFAYLAIRSLKKLPISFPNTTGVLQPISGGKLIK